MISCTNLYTNRSQFLWDQHCPHDNLQSLRNRSPTKSSLSQFLRNSQQFETLSLQSPGAHDPQVLRQVLSLKFLFLLQRWKSWWQLVTISRHGMEEVALGLWVVGGCVGCVGGSVLGGGTVWLGSTLHSPQEKGHLPFVHELSQL